MSNQFYASIQINALHDLYTQFAYKGAGVIKVIKANGYGSCKSLLLFTHSIFHIDLGRVNVL